MLHSHARCSLLIRPATRGLALFVTLVSIVALVPAVVRPAAAAGDLVPDYLAQRHGLTRAWFSQAQVDRSRHRVVRAVLDGDRLVVLTTAGVLHAMDANTGRTVWVVRLGNPDHPSLGPDIDQQHVALVNGSTLFVLERETGLETMSVELGGGAGGGPALTEQFVYVPMFTGKMEAYPLDEEDSSPWYYVSTGRVFDSPVSTPSSIVWPTDRGYLYVANPAANGVRYRFESSSRIVGEPASSEGLLYAASASGYVYALDEQTGQQRWRHSTGVPIVFSPVVVSGDVYVATEQPALHCLSASDGELRWEAPDITQLVGVSESRVYGINRRGTMMMVDRTSGVRLGALEAGPGTMAVVNADTDRLYLVSETGLVQCLHELDSEEPYQHTPPEPEAEDADEETDQQPAADDPDEQPEAAEEDVNPFGAPDDDGDPFGTPDDGGNPFGAPDDGGNPFGAPADDEAADEEPAEADENPFGF